MKTIYFSSICDDYEAEGMFDEKGHLLGMWSCNDATWRDEYFGPFMKELGIVIDDSGVFDDRLRALAEEMWG